LSKRRKLQSDTNKNYKLFIIENNYVRFKDVTCFNNVMIVLNKLKTSELAKWEKDNGISNSLRTTESDTNNYVAPEDRLVTDLRFAFVINKDGMFAIGDSMSYYIR
jgi:hypothetical protein